MANALLVFGSGVAFGFALLYLTRTRSFLSTSTISTFLPVGITHHSEGFRGNLTLPAERHAIQRPWRYLRCTAKTAHTRFITDDRVSVQWLTFGQQPWLDVLAAMGNCSLPQAGYFVKLSTRKRRFCNHSTELSGGSRGHWASSSEWRPRSCTESIWLGPSDVNKCLAGRILLFQGDSLTRQLFLRLVAWIRGLPVVMDHYFHNHAVYSFDAVGDELNVSKGQKNDATLVLWLNKLMPLGRTILLFRHAEQGGEPDLGFLSKLSKAGKIAGVISGHFETFSVRWSHNGRWASDSLSLDSMNNAAGAPHYYRRNAIGVGMKPGLSETNFKEMGQIEHGWTSYLRWRNVKFLRNADAHFQCGMEPRWPATATRWKMPINGDCRDIIGLNAVHALLHRICVR